MTNIFTLETIFRIADLLNLNKLEFDTRITSDEWTVIQQDSLLHTVILDNSVIGEFTFTRIRDSREYCLTDVNAKTIAARFWHNITEFINDVIDDPMLLDKF